MRTRLAILLLLGGFTACGTSESPAPSPGPATQAKDSKKARMLIEGGAVVIDVRTAGEFAEGHVPNAVNLPVQEFPQHLTDVAKLVGNDKSKPVVVYCAKGGRAAKAKQQLDAEGYSNVVNGGGYDDLR